MDRLNVFAHFESKSPAHEDALTRAFMLVVRLIPMAHELFIHLIRKNAELSPEAPPLPHLWDIDRPQGIVLQTQVGSLSPDAANLLSILITDEAISIEKDVHKSDRGVRYDGVIYYAPDWVFVIENKPWHGNVWSEQLSPNLSGDAGDEIRLERRPVILRWRDIIEQMAVLSSRHVLSFLEQRLVEDFLIFTRENFPLLNPYTTFSVCHDNLELLNRRCQTAMRIVEQKLGLNASEYADRIIFPGDPPCLFAYLGAYENPSKDWAIRLRLYPADTIRQARSFYSSVNPDALRELQKEGWDVHSNFHLSFMATNLVWTRGKLALDEYIHYWQSQTNKIAQVSVSTSSEFTSLFNDLERDGLVSGEDRTELDERFTNTARRQANLCPGLALYYVYSAEQAKLLEQSDDFERDVAWRIRTALASWRQKI